MLKWNFTCENKGIWYESAGSIQLDLQSECII